MTDLIYEVHWRDAPTSERTAALYDIASVLHRLDMLATSQQPYIRDHPEHVQVHLLNFDTESAEVLSADRFRATFAEEDNTP